MLIADVEAFCFANGLYEHMPVMWNMYGMMRLILCEYLGSIWLGDGSSEPSTSESGEEAVAVLLWNFITVFLLHSRTTHPNILID